MKIQEEAQDLDGREILLKAKETQQVQKELKAAKSQLQTVLLEFENQLRTANADNFHSLTKKSESAISSIIEAHRLGDDLFVTEKDGSSYAPQLGDQVNVKGLGGKLATVVEEPGDDDETVLVQYGNIRVRVKKGNIIAVPDSERNGGTSSVRHSRRQVCIVYYYKIRIYVFSFLLIIKQGHNSFTVLLMQWLMDCLCIAGILVRKACVLWMAQSIEQTSLNFLN